jgi:hypothetical protein
MQFAESAQPGLGLEPFLGGRSKKRRPVALRNPVDRLFKFAAPDPLSVLATVFDGDFEDSRMT